MTRPQSRSKRQAAYVEEAKRMFDQLEEWYDAHPQASFGERRKSASDDES